jgi:Protein of unknown function with HXXEE motif
MLARLYLNWVYGGFTAAILFIILMPLLTFGWPIALILTYLALPAYMLHQYEEHDKDRFRVFVNQHLGHGANLLTTQATFVINIFGVWLVIAISLYLACIANPGFGLIAIYLMVINAIVHVISALVLRIYNPGLVTAILIFVPLGIFSIYVINQGGWGGLPYQLLGVAVATLIHIAIMAHLFIRRHKLAVQSKSLS